VDIQGVETFTLIGGFRCVVFIDASNVETDTCKRLTKDRPDFSSERALRNNKPATV
jgi:hypothetical protein